MTLSSSLTAHLPPHMLEEISQHKHHLLTDPPTLSWMNRNTLVGSHAVFVYPRPEESLLPPKIKIIVGVYVKYAPGRSTFFEFPFGNKKCFYNADRLDEGSRKKLFDKGIKSIYLSCNPSTKNTKTK